MSEAELMPITGREPEPQSQLPMASPVGFELTPEYVERAEQQVELFKRLKTALLRITDQEDWMDQSGKPYLLDAGVQKVARIAKVEFTDMDCTRHDAVDEDGTKWIQFRCQLTGHWNRMAHADVGIASTKDAFFAKSRGQKVSLDRIDLGNVEKKAVTNAQHRVLTKLLGLSPTWNQLRSAGVLRSEAQGVRYQGQGRKDDGVGQWSQEKGRLEHMLLELVNGNHDAREEWLEKTFKRKVDVKGLSNKDVAWVLPQIEKDHSEQFGVGEQEK